MITPDRPPDLILRDRHGDIYLHRWWVVPRNDDQNIYLHQFTGDDDDRAPHDHPYDSVSHILEVGYDEQMSGNTYRRRPGEIITRRSHESHRVVLLRDEAGYKLPSWSLFVTGPRLVHPVSGKFGDWGFYLPTGWVSQEVINKGNYTGSGDTKKEWAE
jgi:hypothetical protein